MNFRSGKNLAKYGKARAKRHGLTVKEGKRKGEPRRWLKHQLAGDRGYSNTEK